MNEAPTSTSSLATALVAAQRAARGAEKLSHNENHGYDYASADDVVTACREALTGAGLAFTPVAYAIAEWTLPAVPEVAKPACQITVTYRLIHGPSGAQLDIESAAVPVIAGKGRPIDRAIFAARTLGLGYALRDLLCLPRVGVTLPPRESSEREAEREDVADPVQQARRDAAIRAKADARAESDKMVAEHERVLGRARCVELAKEAGVDWPPRSTKRIEIARRACAGAMQAATRNEGKVGGGDGAGTDR